MMGDLRIENPKTTEQFRDLLSTEDAPLPWTEGEDGSVYDANGEFVLQVDPDSERPDEKTYAIAAWLVVAVNTCGGFRAERPEEEKN